MIGIEGFGSKVQIPNCIILSLKQTLLIHLPHPQCYTRPRGTGRHIWLQLEDLRLESSKNFLTTEEALMLGDGWEQGTSPSSATSPNWWEAWGKMLSLGRGVSQGPLHPASPTTVVGDVMAVWQRDPNRKSRTCAFCIGSGTLPQSKRILPEQPTGPHSQQGILLQPTRSLAAPLSVLLGTWGLSSQRSRGS